MKSTLRSALRNAVVILTFFSSLAPLSARVDQPSQFVVLSARGQVGTGDGALIGGFLISGGPAKQVLIRAAGPALQSFGVSGSLNSVRITLYSGSREIASHQGGTPPANSADVTAAAAKVGAFPLSAESLNAAFLVTLEPGAYTATVTSPTAATGVALLEIYEVPASSSGSVLTAANRTRIQQIVADAVRNYEIPGILYSIKFPGEQPWSQAAGVRSTATREALMPDDYFRIGSATKTFIGAATLRAVEENRIHLESTIDKLLPAGVLSNYRRNQITVRMLLNHTSGINSYTNFIDSWFFPYILNRTRKWSDTELIELVNAKFSDPELGQIATPGAVWYYSNTNTVLLGVILERLYNKPIQQILQEQFLTPLGLTKTIYPLPGESAMPEPYARGYMNWANYVGEPSLPATDLDVSVYDASGVGPAGAMISTTADLARWIEALAKQPVGSPSMRRGHMDWKYFVAFGAAASTPGVAAPSYGMNMAHEPDITNGADYWIVGHRGQISGYDTAMMYLPEQETAIVVACTRSLKNAPGLPTNAATVALNAIVNVLFPKLITDTKANLDLPAQSADSESSPMPRARALQPARSVLPLSEY